MVIQKKYYLALILGMSTISYGMDNFFTEEQKKNIHPLIRCALYTGHKIEAWAQAMKVENNKQGLQSDTVFTASGGSFRTVGTYGPIIVVEKVAKL